MVVMVVMVASARLESGFLYAGGFTVFAFAVATLILATIESQWAGNRLLSVVPLRLTGRVSYGLYLWHLPIFLAVARECQSWSSATRIVVALGITAFFTMASWQLVERPALRVKRRLSR
jgi:peptidoglycan/LPS O-acetylase OafA/YrhL